MRTWLAGLLALNGSPRGIAGGFALGTGFSLVPIPVAGMLAALALAPLLRVNLPATYLGTAIVNPITGVVFYAGELWLGSWLLGQPLPSWETLRGLSAAGWWDMFQSMLGPFLLGAAVAVPVLAGAGYLAVYAGVKAWRRRSAGTAPEAAP